MGALLPSSLSPLLTPLSLSIKERGGGREGGGEAIDKRESPAHEWVICNEEIKRTKNVSDRKMVYQRFFSGNVRYIPGFPAPSERAALSFFMNEPVPIITRGNRSIPCSLSSSSSLPT